VRDGVARGGIVGDVVGLGVGEVVEEDGAPDDATVLGPFYCSVRSVCAYW